MAQTSLLQCGRVPQPALRGRPFHVLTAWRHQASVELPANGRTPTEGTPRFLGPKISDSYVFFRGGAREDTMEECIKIRKLKRPAWVDQVLHQAVQLGLSGWIALEEGFPGHDVAVGPFRFVGPDNIEHLVAQMSAADWLRGYAAGYAARTHEVQQLLDACKRAEGGTVDDTE